MSYRFTLPAALALTALTISPVLAQSNSGSGTLGGAATPPGAGASVTGTTPGASGASPGMTGTTPGAMSPAAGSAATTPMNGANSKPSFMTADHHLRASKLIGSDVYDAQHQKIGTVDDLILSSKNHIGSAVLSVGGFLGIDSKLVKVPYSELHIVGSRITMSGATKQELTKMPSYSFTKAG